MTAAVKREKRGFDYKKKGRLKKTASKYILKIEVLHQGKTPIAIYVLEIFFNETKKAADLKSSAFLLRFNSNNSV